LCQHCGRTGARQSFQSFRSDCGGTEIKEGLKFWLDVGLEGGCIGIAILNHTCLTDLNRGSKAGVDGAEGWAFALLLSYEVGIIYIHGKIWMQLIWASLGYILHWL
jgi:hypothetical protein